MFTKLSNDTRHEINTYLDTTALSRISGLTRAEYLKPSDPLWEAHVAKYYPCEYQYLAEQTTVNWRQEFIALTNQEFPATLTAHLRFLCLNAREGNISALSNLTKKDFAHNVDQLTAMPILIKAARKQQHILDYFYNLMIQWYDPPATDSAYKLFYYAIFCRQPIATIYSIYDPEHFNIHYGKWNPLGNAIMAGHLELVAHMILNQGVDINNSNNDLSPLMLATLYEQTEIVDFLLQHQADVNFEARYNSSVNGFTLPGRHALELAMFRKNFTMTRSLINAGARPTDFHGTYLNMACPYGDIRTISWLLHIQPETLDIKGTFYQRTPLLQYFYAQRDTAFPQPYDIYQLFRDAGADFTVLDRNGEGIVHFLTDSNDGVKIFNDLLQHGLFNTSDAYQRLMPTVHKAAINHQPELLKLFIQLYPELNPEWHIDIKNNYGSTALMSVLARQDSANPLSSTVTKTIKILLDAGADLQKINPKWMDKMAEILELPDVNSMRLG